VEELTGEDVGDKTVVENQVGRPIPSRHRQQVGVVLSIHTASFRIAGPGHPSIIRGLRALGKAAYPPYPEMGGGQAGLPLDQPVLSWQGLVTQNGMRRAVSDGATAVHYQPAISQAAHDIEIVRCDQRGWWKGGVAGQ